MILPLALATLCLWNEADWQPAAAEQYFEIRRATLPIDTQSETNLNVLPVALYSPVCAEPVSKNTRVFLHVFINATGTLTVLEAYSSNKTLKERIVHQLQGRKLNVAPGLRNRSFEFFIQFQK